MPAVDPAETLHAHPELGLLEVAVPMWIDRLRHSTAEQRQAIGQRCGQHIASHGDDLMFRGKRGSSAEAFNALAEGLAALAYCPGGVSFASMHFCTAACCTCHDTGTVYVGRCTCGGLVNGPPGVYHDRDCGMEVCPKGCEIPPAALPEPDQSKRRTTENVELPDA
jgi:hypothetical protein